MHNPLPNIKEFVRVKRVKRMIRKDGEKYRKNVAAYAHFNNLHHR